LVRRYTGHSLKFTPYDTSILAYVNKNRIHYNYNMVVSLIQSVKKKKKKKVNSFNNIFFVLPITALVTGVLGILVTAVAGGCMVW